jgi:hypothetical protein
MQGAHYALMAFLAILLGGGTIVAYQRAKKGNGSGSSYRPYGHNQSHLTSTIGTGYSQSSPKSPGCGCSANKH